MAKKTRNINTSISYEGRHSLYKMEYQDQSGNQWRVDVKGEPQTVSQFIKRLRKQEADEGVSFGVPGSSPAARQPFYCNSAVLTPQEVEEHKKMMDKKLTKLQALPTPTPGPVSAPAPEMPAPEEFSMEVTLSMVQAEHSGPYRVSFVIDPKIRETDLPHKYTIKLRFGDSMANVSYTADGGKVKVVLSAPSGFPTDTHGPGNSGRVQLAAQGIMSWPLTVRGESGRPEYELRGDITVLYHEQYPG